jgi:DUF2946 family protein
VDELVLRGMAKWPNVPAVYGWLRLDRRGNWLIKGEPVSNPTIIAFIGRNYASDEHGQWYFQNGPQRVFVALGYTPFVYRVAGVPDGPIEIEAHNGLAASTISGAWFDEIGALLLLTELGVGVVHDQDLERLIPFFIDANGNAVPEDVFEELMGLAEQGRPVPLWLKLRDISVKLEPIRAAEVPGRFGFVSRPTPPAGQDAST